MNVPVAELKSPVLCHVTLNVSRLLIIDAGECAVNADVVAVTTYEVTITKRVDKDSKTSYIYNSRHTILFEEYSVE